MPCYLCFTLQQHPVVSRIYIYSFISLFIYAVLNIFIAIIEDAFFASKAVRSTSRGHSTYRSSVGPCLAHALLSAHGALSRPDVCAPDC